MKHRWIATGSSPMTEEQALEWAGYDGETGVTKTDLELFLTDVFCALCDRTFGDAPDKCSGPAQPSLVPHRWRLMTTTMLTDGEALNIYLDNPDPFPTSLPQGLNVYCVLCGAPFDARELSCTERRALSRFDSTISDEELARIVHGPSEKTRFQWQEIRWIGHDSWMALGDSQFDKAACAEASDHFGMGLVNTAATFPFICCATQADAPVPVEVARDSSNGDIIGVRVCWTDDVDKVDGYWEKVGRVAINESCRAWDPRHHIEEGGLEFEMRAGIYDGEVYIHKGDTLGMRLIPSAT